MDAIELAHLAALHVGLRACPDQISAADMLMYGWQCPSSCLPVAAAAGAVAVAELAVERWQQVGW